MEAELRRAREPARREPPDLAGADDEGAHPAELGAPPSMDDRDRRRVRYHEQRGREAPQAHGVVRARLVAEGERRDELRRHRGHCGGRHDQAGVVEHLEAEPVTDSVDARRVEDDQSHDDERHEGGARERASAVEGDRGERGDDQRGEIERGAERSSAPLRGPRRAMPVPGWGSRCRLGQRAEGTPSAGFGARDGERARSHGITEFDGERLFGLLHDDLAPRSPRDASTEHADDPTHSPRFPSDVNPLPRRERRQTRFSFSIRGRGLAVNPTFGRTLPVRWSGPARALDRRPRRSRCASAGAFRGASRAA